MKTSLAVIVACFLVVPHISNCAAVNKETDNKDDREFKNDLITADNDKKPKDKPDKPYGLVKPDEKKADDTDESDEEELKDNEPGEVTPKDTDESNEKKPEDEPGKNTPGRVDKSPKNGSEEYEPEDNTSEDEPPNDKKEPEKDDSDEVEKPDGEELGENEPAENTPEEEGESDKNEPEESQPDKEDESDEEENKSGENTPEELELDENEPEEGSKENRPGELDESDDNNPDDNNRDDNNSDDNNPDVNNSDDKTPDELDESDDNEPEGDETEDDKKPKEEESDENSSRKLDVEKTVNSNRENLTLAKFNSRFGYGDTSPPCGGSNCGPVKSQVPNTKPQKADCSGTSCGQENKQEHGKRPMSKKQGRYKTHAQDQSDNCGGSTCGSGGNDMNDPELDTLIGVLNQVNKQSNQKYNGAQSANENKPDCDGHFCQIPDTSSGRRENPISPHNPHATTSQEDACSFGNCDSSQVGVSCTGSSCGPNEEQGATSTPAQSCSGIGCDAGLNIPSQSHYESPNQQMCDNPQGCSNPPYTYQPQSNGNYDQTAHFSTENQNLNKPTSGPGHDGPTYPSRPQPGWQNSYTTPWTSNNQQLNRPIMPSQFATDNQSNIPQLCNDAHGCSGPSYQNQPEVNTQYTYTANLQSENQKQQPTNRPQPVAENQHSTIPQCDSLHGCSDPSNPNQPQSSWKYSYTTHWSSDNQQPNQHNNMIQPQIPQPCNNPQGCGGDTYPNQPHSNWQYSYTHFPPVNTNPNMHLTRGMPHQNENISQQGPNKQTQPGQTYPQTNPTFQQYPEQMQSNQCYGPNCNDDRTYSRPAQQPPTGPVYPSNQNALQIYHNNQQCSALLANAHSKLGQVGNIIKESYERYVEYPAGGRNLYEMEHNQRVKNADLVRSMDRANSIYDEAYAMCKYSINNIQGTNEYQDDINTEIMNFLGKFRDIFSDVQTEFNKCVYRVHIPYGPNDQFQREMNMVHYTNIAEYKNACVDLVKESQKLIQKAQAQVPNNVG